MATQKRFIAKNGIDNNNKSIVNVLDPVNDQDVATKAFVLSSASTGGPEQIAFIQNTAISIAIALG